MTVQSSIVISYLQIGNVFLIWWGFQPQIFVAGQSCHLFCISAASTLSLWQLKSETTFWHQRYASSASLYLTWLDHSTRAACTTRPRLWPGFMPSPCFWLNSMLASRSLFRASTTCREMLHQATWQLGCSSWPCTFPSSGFCGVRRRMPLLNCLRRYEVHDSSL